MTITAQSIIRDAQVALQDPDGTRWPADELVIHLNRAQRDIQTVRPDTTATLVAVPLVAGFKQNLPAAAASLIDIPANTTGERVTKVDLVQLDAVEANWRKRRPELVAKHFMHDLRNPRVILVYPPVATGASVDMEYSAWPVDIPAPTGATASSVTGNLSLGDQYDTAALSMVLHYAYAKDAEFGGNAALSAAYLQRAQALLGADLQSSATVAPKS
jgi:hypothetical protein